MAEVTLDLKAWKKWLGEVSFEKAARRGLLSGAHRAIPVLHRSTDNAPTASPRGAIGANNTGSFRRSWKSSRTNNGVVVFNSSPYAPIIEKGRRKGKMPPVKAIAKWAQRRTGLSRKEAERVAFAMALAIKNRGLGPRNVLKSSLGEIRRLMIDEIHRELRLELSA